MARPLIQILLVLVALCRVGRSAEAAEVTVLTDATFEHQTQSSTGQTTGKWFVKFYAPCKFRSIYGRVLVLNT